MKTSTLLWRLCMLALAMTLVLPLLPALAEEDAGNAPQNPAVILAANPTTATPGLWRSRTRRWFPSRMTALRRAMSSH